MNELFRKAVEPFGFPGALVDCACASLERVAGAWAKRDETALAVGAKVLKCFAEAGLHQGHLAGTTGYGYHDSGREAYEALLARTLGAQASMARLHFVSGTHAIVAATHALLGPEGRLCSVTGAPYDTLRVALTAPLENDKRNGRGRYLEVPLSPDGTHDPYGVAAALKSSPEVIFLQRSRGYARRQATSIEEIASIVALTREQSPSSAILVDNCYGEFVELREPCEVGADVIVGSLIKNPGGGIAPAGAYVAGASELVERIASATFAPGLGTKVGPSLETTRWFLAGLHRAPRIVGESLKILDFAAALFEELGFAVDPKPGEHRSDIIQAIELGSENLLRKFCEGLQCMLPINARARPEAGQVPGYDDPVIMGMGSFIDGSTMELSCDAPLRPPYEVYLQGGMDVTHGVIAVMSAAQALS